LTHISLHVLQFTRYDLQDTFYIWFADSHERYPCQFILLDHISLFLLVFNHHFTMSSSGLTDTACLHQPFVNDGIIRAYACKPQFMLLKPLKECLVFVHTVCALDKSVLFVKHVHQVYHFRSQLSDIR
jgi:hypothetical protein